ncbi:hypothetical protein PR048_029401 [Dryococelus australis]|uniref:Uncharacterized protein n=1 Tax=Dryococelus australis TaxID=614101 RepID=A0ABQ9GDA0_9NEOP|nr:hypothetical protein PR048_029401 [Dryococelus australis]
MEQRRNAGAGETVNPRENPSTRSTVRHDPHERNREQSPLGIGIKWTSLHGNKVNTLAYHQGDPGSSTGGCESGTQCTWPMTTGFLVVLTFTSSMLRFMNDCSLRATSCSYNSSHPVWHALYECLQDIHKDSSPFLLQPFHELSNGFWPRLTSPRPAIQFVPKMFYRVEVGALGGTLLSTYHCKHGTWHYHPGRDNGVGADAELSGRPRTSIRPTTPHSRRFVTWCGSEVGRPATPERSPTSVSADAGAASGGASAEVIQELGRDQAWASRLSALHLHYTSRRRISRRYIRSCNAKLDPPDFVILGFSELPPTIVANLKTCSRQTITSHSGVVAWSFPDFRMWTVPDAVRRVFSEISRFPSLYVTALFHAHYASPSSDLKILMKKEPPKSLRKPHPKVQPASRALHCMTSLPLVNGRLLSLGTQPFIHSNSKTRGPEARRKFIVLRPTIWKVRRTPRRAERTRSAIQSILQMSSENNTTRVSGTRLSIPGGVASGSRVWRSCRTMPLVGGVFSGSPAVAAAEGGLRGAVLLITSQNADLYLSATQKIILRTNADWRGYRLFAPKWVERVERDGHNSGIAVLPVGGRENFRGSSFFNQSHAVNQRELGAPLLSHKNGFLELDRATKTGTSNSTLGSPQPSQFQKSPATTDIPYPPPPHTFAFWRCEIFPIGWVASWRVRYEALDCRMALDILRNKADASRNCRDKAKNLLVWVVLNDH